ncbi:MAG: hypothetical protein FJX74_09150, partial [Armatimonadetes bacterium]|nr:hypothetical protein [Armatimonadota bacterium]
MGMNHRGGWHMARRLCGGLLLLALAGGVGWFLWGRLSRGVAYWRDAAIVRHAEGALDDGRPVVALQLLAEAGEPGRRRLGRLLVASHAPDRWPPLIDALQNAGPLAREGVAAVLERSSEERLCAAEALAALGDARGVQALALALALPDPGAHEPVELAALGPPGVKALSNVAQSGPRAGAERAVELLGGAQSAAARRALIDLLTDRDCPRRTQALRAVAWHSFGDLRPWLSRMLADPDPVFRAEALYQYGAAGGHEALPALRRALDDPQTAVRSAVVEAAALIEGPEADELIIRALQDAAEPVRRKAVCSLGWRCCRDADAALARIYPDSSPDLQRDIVAALHWIGSPLGPEYRARWER